MSVSELKTQIYGNYSNKNNMQGCYDMLIFEKTT